MRDEGLGYNKYSTLLSSAALLYGKKTKRDTNFKLHLRIFQQAFYGIKIFINIMKDAKVNLD